MSYIIVHPYTPAPSCSLISQKDHPNWIVLRAPWWSTRAFSLPPLCPPDPHVQAGSTSLASVGGGEQHLRRPRLEWLARGGDAWGWICGTQTTGGSIGARPVRPEQRGGRCEWGRSTYYSNKKLRRVEAIAIRLEGSYHPAGGTRGGRQDMVSWPAQMCCSSYPSTLCDHDVEPMTPCKRKEAPEPAPVKAEKDRSPDGKERHQAFCQ